MAKMTQRDVIDDVLELLEKSKSVDQTVLVTFVAQLQLNLKWKVTSIEEGLSNCHPFGNSQKRASGTSKKNKSQLLSSKKNSGSLLCQNVRIFPKNVVPYMAIQAQPLYYFSLDIKEPFVPDVFKIEKRENDNFYIVLERNSGSPGYVLTKYIKKDQTLHMDRLHDDIMKELTDIIRDTHVPGMKTEVEKTRSAVQIHLGSLFEGYGFEITPSIPVTSLIWKDCPALVAIGKLPKLVQKVIRYMKEKEDLHLFVSLLFKVDPSKYEETVKNMVYNSVEAEFFSENDDICAMVKLVRLVWQHFCWLKYGLSELHIREIVLRESDNLCFKTKKEGYKYILKSIKEELATTTTSPDFFIKKAHFGIEEKQISSLLESIDQALKLVPEDLLSIVKSYHDVHDEVI
ncbi:uncharacterized protein LOC143038012 isoform X1 [Oratosquilla oratoria]|uniref:uncharacterized protein LOC143038012 isoform X1 n=1 Tax=Oratosquilla oratoria TaxID=337810 RepID=UPI003F76E31E